MKNFNYKKSCQILDSNSNTHLETTEISLGERDLAFQFDFFDNTSHTNDFYDTTRLIVLLPHKYSRDAGNNPVYNCYVSWYGKHDASTLEQNEISNLIPQFLNNSQLYDKDKEPYRRDQMENILVGLDLNNLQFDTNYCKITMNNLLRKKRVEKEYLQPSLKGQKSTGNYVGGLRILPDGTYDKYFDQTLGQNVHNSPECKKARYEYQQKSISHHNIYGCQQHDTQIYNSKNHSINDDGR